LTKGKKTNAKRKKPDGQIYLSKSGFAFCLDANEILQRQKNGSPGGDRTHDQLLKDGLEQILRLDRSCYIDAGVEEAAR
jgi:hypothetical protein